MELINSSPKSSTSGTLSKAYRPFLKKVLIVDNDRDSSNYMKISLENQNKNIQCVVVHDPYEAVIRLTDENYDLALIDDRMIELEGTEILLEAERFIEEDPSIPEYKKEKVTPVILISHNNLKSKIKNLLHHFDIRVFMKRNEFNILSHQ